MSKVKKVFMLVLIVAVVSLGLMGCKEKKEHPTGDEHPSTEHPSGEHPK
jgi:hypothetical protein